MLRFLVVLIASVFFAELVIMLTLPGHEIPVAISVHAATVSIAILFPLLYFTVLGPRRRANDRRVQAQAAAVRLARIVDDATKESEKG